MVGTPTGKLLRVTDTYTHRGYRWRLFLGTSIRQRLSVATAPESASAACPFDTGPQPAPIIHCSRGGGEQRAAAPSQLKHLINRCYLERLVLPRWQKACSRSAFTFGWSCPAALLPSFRTVNSCHHSNMQKNRIAMGERSFWFAINLFFFTVMRHHDVINFFGSEEVSAILSACHRTVCIFTINSNY